MTPTDLSALTALLDREAIRDALYRYCRGIDRVDEDALRAAYWPDAPCRHGAHQGTADEFIAEALKNRRTAGRAIHMIGNILIDLRGEVAAVESYFRSTIATRDADGQPQETLLAGRYIDRFERRAGEWRIGARTIAYDWVRQNAHPSVMEPEAFGLRQPTGGHQPDDPLYELLAQAPFSKSPS